MSNERRSTFHRLVVDSSRSAFALCIGIASGLVAVLIDLDHITMLFGHPDGRVAHTPLLVLAISVALYCGARIAGLLIRMVLRRQSKF